VWHIPAVQDWAVNTWIGGGPGLNEAPEWAAKGLAVCPAPFGMELGDADRVAAAVSPQDVLDYAGAVTARTLAWLDSLADSDLEQVPAINRQHLSLHPVYSTPDTGTKWRAGSSGACYGHSRGHFGELDLTLTIIRSR
jgi:hypothetical protein